MLALQIDQRRDQRLCLQCEQDIQMPSADRVSLVNLDPFSNLVAADPGKPPLDARPMQYLR